MPDPTVCPDVLSGLVSYFGDAIVYNAGTYTISYVTGTYKINPDAPWGVEYDDHDAQIGLLHGFYVVDGAGNIGRGPGNSQGYETQAEVAAGNAGATSLFEHAGGSIGIYLLDGYYPDNVAGDPCPTFSLSAVPTVILYATPTNGPCGVYELSWEVGPDPTVISSVSIDQGIGSVGTSGSQAVTVDSGSMTYTLIATSTVGTTTAQATVSRADYNGATGASPSAEPSVLSPDPMYFDSGFIYPAGLYFVEYLDGAYNLENGNSSFWDVSAVVTDTSTLLSVQSITDSPPVVTTANPHDLVSGQAVVITGVQPLVGGPDGFFSVTVLSPTTFLLNSVASVDVSGGTGFVDGGHSLNVGPPFETLFATEADALAAISSGQSYPYCHVGGKPIGVYIIDSNYPDNVQGSPPFTVRLAGPSPMASIAASPTLIVAGSAVTLSWSAVGWEANIDNGVGTLFSTPSNTTGTLTVNPTSTTTYALTSTTDGFTDAMASVTVMVLPPAVDSFSASPSTICAGATSTLAWSTTGAASVSIDNGVGTVAAGGSTSVSPTSSTTYTITATNGSGTATSTATVTVNALAPTPSFTLTARGARVIVGWIDPGDGYGTLTVNIYCGTSSGGESLIQSGLSVGDGQFVDLGLMSGTTYYYRVSFANGCGEGALAAEQSVTPVCCQNDYTATTTPSTSYAASTVPSSTAAASTPPMSTAVSSTPPSTTYSTSPPPSTTYTSDGCPD